MTDAPAAPAAPATTPVAPAAPAAAPAAPATTEPAAFDWAGAGLDTDSLGYVQTKGFKDPAAVLGSYRNLEKLHGVPAEQLVKLPGADAKPEDWAPIYDRLGRPKSADMYDVPLPEGDTGEFAKTAKGWFHKAGLSVRQAKAVAEEWNAHVTATVQAEQAKAQKAADEAVAALRTEWGTEFDKRSERVDRAAETFGMTKDQLVALKQAMGPAAAMKFLDNLGTKLGTDDTIVNGDGQPAGFGKMTPEQAQSAILQRQNDKAFIQRFASGDADARREMDALHAQAYPGDTILGR